jgi:hypothetical protein
VSKRARFLAAALAVVGAVGLVVWLAASATPRIADDPLAAVPVEAVAVARIDVPAVRRSSLWRIGVDGGDRALRRIERRCGRDPLTGLSHLDVFVTGERAGSLDHVGFIVRGDLDPEALARCVGRLVEEEEGGALREVDIEGVPAVAPPRGSSRAAFVGAGAIVGGHERLVRSVISVARGDARSAREGDALPRLWEEVAEGSHVALAARVPDHWRATVARYLGDDDELDDARAAVAGLRGLGLSVRLRDGAAAGVLLEMEDAEAAGRLEEAIRRRVAELLRRPLVSLSVAGPVLRRIRTEADGRDVVVTAEVRDDELPSLIDLFRELARRRAEGEDGADAAPPLPLPAPDEILHPTE